ncbi:hypothetical protein AXF42_Ash001451 [Apostasia shenzhenica]|uniref:Coiled-coil domain-containing protein SCD2 n=1 Tax=Apostasia shenzhenica TaxID=1088818 RepID=A0A2I0AUX9_9ASPA|nr:hypothetical protein AXF42_Ash001451 [Apostasia shenzhenica]
MMEKGRAPSPVYARQKSMSGSTAGAPSSPMMSPTHRHVRSGSTGVGNSRRAQNSAARAAAQRLARVMAHQHDDDSSDDDDAALPPPIELSTPRRANRSPSPAIGRYLADQSPVRPTSTGRPSMVCKPSPMIPPIKPLPRPVVTSIPSDSPVTGRREKRMSLDLGNFSMREPVQPHSSSTLQDVIDALQEENENILEKLRFAEERCEEAEARAKQLEKQVSSLGQGVSFEARLLSRKEAALQQKEVLYYNLHLDQC